ncbi:GNAT family N-acetyltransferase [Desulfosarcina sp.]|uniref:GNAT family N-acetyltransferase n=1 Tax=Desulfosarcina sp. TaxID=2027861 RepID=UPI0039708D04
MAGNSYWADGYVQKRCTAEDAIGHIRPGQRVFIGSSCGEPQHLVKTLSEATEWFTDLEIVRLMSLETAPLSLIADRTRGQRLNIRSFYMGSAKSKHLAEKARFLTPLNLSAVPRLFKSRRMPIHVALIQTTPPDDFGWLSLGVSVDITLAAANSANLVIAQVNPEMPRVLGRSFIHVNDVHLVVEKQEPILTLPTVPESEAADTIARLIARLIEDGSTLQISPGTAPQATLMTLADKNDLGIHTQYLTNEIMHLFARGVITNRRKGLNNGKMVASSAIGSPGLYEFIDNNPGIEFHPSDYVNAPGIIAAHNKMVSLSVAMAMDLTGQVAADALEFNNFSGVTGMLDFIRGAFQSEGGRSIIMLPATALGGKKSRVVPMLSDTAIVVPRADVHYVATEFGVVNLFGKSLQERAMAMISIAHPDFRDELLHQAKQLKLIGAQRTLKGALQGVYPLRLEETLVIDGQNVTIRPAKPVDERRIQEHFYTLGKNDILARFFHEKTSFGTDDVGDVSQVDYIRNLTILAVVGEFGFGKVVGIGEYLLDPACNLAEVAFSVSGAWQGKGLGRRMMKKLFEGARENGIAGFTAYTAPGNKAMISLFNSLPVNVSTTMEDGMAALECRFDDMKIS